MEDINLFIINQRHLIENEYYQLKTNSNDFNKLDICNISSYYDDINKEILDINKQIEIDKQIDKKDKNNNSLFLILEDIEKLLDSFNNGIYGIINYYKNNDVNDINKLIKYLTKSNFEYYNKSTIVNKLIKNGKPTQELKDESYGIVFLYKKENNEIESLNKVYLLKNGDITNMNNSHEEEEEEDKIITKIYEFGNKIVLKEIIYESNINLINDIDNDSIKKRDELESKRVKLDNLLKMIKKYYKYLDENIKSIEIRDFLSNFNFIKNFIKKISDPSKQQLKIDDVLKMDFSEKLLNIKISNRLDISEYNSQINLYFDESIEDITNTVLESYDINSHFKPYILILFDILFRIHIDIHLGNKSYCLSKSYSDYFDFNFILSEPATVSSTLRRRYWNQLLEDEIEDSTKKIITSLLMLIKNKTYTIDDTLKYLDQMYKDVSMVKQR